MKERREEEIKWKGVMRDKLSVKVVLVRMRLLSERVIRVYSEVLLKNSELVNDIG